MTRELKLIKTEDGSDSLYVPELKETYHSFHGAVQESRHVFINAGLQHFLENHKNKKSIKVLEIGLGTGLNALLTAEWAHKNEQMVQMTSLEAYPVPVELARKLNYAQFLEEKSAIQWFELIHSTNWITAIAIHEKFNLTKVEQKLEDYEIADSFDVVFFDAFAPNKQAELWELHMLEKVAGAMNPGGCFVTYCAKGQLKRDLKSIGLEVETLPGPPGKKEMVRGNKPL